MKKQLIISALMIVSSYLLAATHTVNNSLSFIKCLLLAYGITCFSYTIYKRYIKKAHIVLYYMGVIILCMYTILAIDTYFLHALTWFPGMIRYALFSTYGLWYLVFILPGICLSMKKSA